MVPILRVNELQERLDRLIEAVRREAEQLQLAGIPGQPSGRRVPLPGADPSRLQGEAQTALGRPQGRLGSLLGRDLGIDEECLGDLTVANDRNTTRQEPVVFEADLADVPLPRGEQDVQHFELPLHLLGREDLRHVPADDLFGRRLRHGAIDVENVPGAGEQHREVGRALEENAEPLLALALCFLGLAARRYVDLDDQKMRDPPFFTGQRAHRQLTPERAPVPALAEDLAMESKPLGQRGPQLADDLRIAPGRRQETGAMP